MKCFAILLLTLTLLGCSVNTIIPYSGIVLKKKCVTVELEDTTGTLNNFYYVITILSDDKRIRTYFITNPLYYNTSKVGSRINIPYKSSIVDTHRIYLGTEFE